MLTIGVAAFRNCTSLRYSLANLATFAPLSYTPYAVDEEGKDDEVDGFDGRWHA